MSRLTQHYGPLRFDVCTFAASHDCRQLEITPKAGAKAVGLTAVEIEILLEWLSMAFPREELAAAAEATRRQRKARAGITQPAPKYATCGDTRRVPGSMVGMEQAARDFSVPCPDCDKAAQ